MSNKKIVSPFDAKKPVFIQRLDHLQEVIKGFQVSLMQKDYMDSFNNFYITYLLERIVEALAESDSKIDPQDFFSKHAAAAEAKFLKSIEDAKKREAEASENPSKD